MQSKAQTPDGYIDSLPDDRKAEMIELRRAVLENLPEGFQETMSYGMLGYVVPHALYPNGYHCDPKLPLPFINIASQKNFIAVYHMGIYANKQLLEWFTGEYPKYSNKKLDMGKGCIRFKPGHVPCALIGELASKITVPERIAMYESQIKK